MDLHGTALWLYVVAMAAYLAVGIALAAFVLWRRGRQRLELRHTRIRLEATPAVGRADAIVLAAAGSGRLEIVESDERAVRVEVPAGLTAKRRFMLNQLANEAAPATISVQVPRRDR